MEGFGDEVGPTMDALGRLVVKLDEAARGDHLMFAGTLDLPGSIDALGTGGELRAGHPLPPGASGPPDGMGPDSLPPLEGPR